ncbi:MAG: hypothetical protein ACW9W3_07565 [Candidatus Nitrosopumilus sp. bin_68KS]
METLESKIIKEKKHYEHLRMKTQVFGILLIAVGIGFGIALSQGNGMAPVTGGIIAAIYIAVGANILTRYINIKHEEEKSIRDIRMEYKVDEILSKLNGNKI